MLKFFRSLLIAGVLVFAGIHFGSNFAVAKIFENWLGVPVSVQAVRWGLASRQLTLKNIKIHNPPGYQDRALAKIPLVQADYDASDLKKGIFKISHLKITVEEVWLERKSTAESNVLLLNPLRSALGTIPPSPQISLPPISVQIGKVRFQMEKVAFQTRLGNDDVMESRAVQSPQTELTELTTPDRVLIYGVLLALRSAGWSSFLPTREEVTQSAEAQMGIWMEQMRQKAQVLQAQIQQALSEKLNQKPA